MDTQDLIYSKLLIRKHTWGSLEVTSSLSKISLKKRQQQACLENSFRNLLKENDTAAMLQNGCLNNRRLYNFKVYSVTLNHF